MHTAPSRDGTNRSSAHFSTIKCRLCCRWALIKLPCERVVTLVISPYLDGGCCRSRLSPSSTSREVLTRVHRPPCHCRPVVHLRFHPWWRSFAESKRTKPVPHSCRWCNFDGNRPIKSA